jgi:hypothetical protein
MSVVDVTRYQCVQRYLDRHRQSGRFTRWELARKPGRRPNQWLVFISRP